MGSKGRIVGLDVIRSVAVMAVVLEHGLGFYTTLRGRWCYPLGVLGVEMFFVLSGYLIGGILLDTIAKNANTLSAPVMFNFWTRRWLRTIPNYLLFLGVFMLVNPWFKVSQVPSYLTFTQNLFRPVPQFYNISWSLAVEEWFYLLFPVLILLFGVTRTRTRYRFLAATSILFVGPLIFRLACGPGMEWDSGVRKVVAMRLDALMWGVSVAAIKRYASQCFLYLQSIPCFGVGTVMLMGMMVAINLRYPPGRDFVATWADAFWFTGFDVSVALMLPFCVSVNRLAPPLHYFFEKISLWSYSMYLCHLPVMIVVHKYLHMKQGMLIVITGLGIVGISALLYRYFELPIMLLRDKFHVETPRSNEKKEGGMAATV